MKLLSFKRNTAQAIHQKIKELGKFFKVMVKTVSNVEKTVQNARQFYTKYINKSQSLFI